MYLCLFIAVAHALNNEATDAVDLATKLIPTAVPDVTQLQGTDRSSFEISHSISFEGVARQMRNDLTNSNQTAAVILASSTPIVKA